MITGIIIAVATGSKGDASTASEVAQNVCMPNPCKHNGDCSEGHFLSDDSLSLNKQKN